LGAIRQVLALAGMKVFATTPGGFIVLGLLMALFNTLLQMYRDYTRRKFLKEAQ
jgi:Na+-translocating ferredoxin:NAD+ oxidoreductase RnfE subunit